MPEEPEQKTEKIYPIDNLVKATETKEITLLTSKIYPIELLYVDSTLAFKLIDFEFNRGWCTKQSNAKGIYRYRIPETTLEIAKTFNERYAGYKLFEYYKQIPKFIKSDTIYDVYEQLSELLSILVHYNPLGLNQRLKSDYYYWRRIAEKAQSHDYLLQHDRTIGYDQSSIILESDLYPDCNLILIDLASALMELGEPEFNYNAISSLKNKFKIANYEFPKFEPNGFYNFYLSKNEIDLPKSFPDFFSLLHDLNTFETIFRKATSESKYTKFYDIIYSKNTAFIAVLLNGGNGYRVRLNNNKMIIEKVWMVME